MESHVPDPESKSVPEIFVRLREITRYPGLKVVERHCALGTGEDLIINLEVDEEETELTLFAEVGTVSPETKEQTLTVLLNANLLWQKTDGGVLGMIPGSNRVVLASRKPISSLDNLALENFIESFADIAEVWTRHLSSDTEVPDTSGIADIHEPDLFTIKL